MKLSPFLIALAFWSTTLMAEGLDALGLLSRSLSSNGRRWPNANGGSELMCASKPGSFSRPGETYALPKNSLRPIDRRLTWFERVCAEAVLQHLMRI